MSQSSTPLTYALLVTGPAYGTQSARNAYLFAQSVLEKGHSIKRVFFYQEGVLNGSGLTVPANDEFDLVKAWQAMAMKHQIRLETCVSAALRRGIVSQSEAEQHQLSTSSLAMGVTQAGLGALAEALLTEDRVVQF
ncbi:sulfurtransferase complex subunit TusD [Vibrio sp. V31_P5A7T61]|uniref:sulfurtransferase complex subunit TusD n=1 Tax=unclassified Vibrio TaxID=2614977 RepID=UPI001393D8B0|nr:sulfurtransferase complex subunit TusD [Vibrio sp. V31_P5A7T61]NAX02951.1 sulfurtransferase complex subunit TusD [Vibrio sp. V34_P3A8T189]NAX09022.1 sulfurtransferase complex subunit TusD [Vibrio sp. V40_P2S30T141]NAX64531.1 sulfurtransferase complex subunit TusD [Vibrio sp. V32_P6A28T40]